MLWELEGLSYREVASAMSCPIGTVRSRVSRVREAIHRGVRGIFDEGLPNIVAARQENNWPLSAAESTV
jgi:Sigma-70, region 4